MIVAWFPLAAGAHGGSTHSPAAMVPAVREQQDWGIAGLQREVTRTITVRMDDRMRFTPDRIDVGEGETVRLVVHNGGGALHELVIGTSTALSGHAELMQRFPDMEHDEPWMAHVPAGRSGEIVWTFNRPGRFEFACLLAGHFAAGMIGAIDVKPAFTQALAKESATVR
ncbi:plastocyanin [Aromatoleum petrolei]|uniref:Plastocyanin n=2 Tax=Aromatoleum petrolei TaxID=76116 RepID=A0ABX1MLX8_9RHOO|nr:plastocyanin [Aromatoleum petrolei]QTQ36039.1 Blue (type 1) copper domain-containing protein [Aromatoleum petrolei]